MACKIEGDKYYSPNGQLSQLYQDLKDKVGESQAKDLFVLAYTPNFIRDVQQQLIYNYKSKFPEIPNNLKITETKSGKTRIFKTDNGRIILTPYKDGYKIKSVLVDESERSKGIGKALYSFTVRQMISEGLNLYSDQIRTEAADGIWQSFSNLALTDANQKVIYAKPLSAFNENGEIYAENVLEYATQLNENTEPLSFVEQNEVRMMMAEFPDIEDSDELADVLTKAFYKDGLFSPTRGTLRPTYSQYEADLILSDVSILGTVKESLEKLKRTPKIYNTTILEAVYKINELNNFGKLKTENPYIIQQDIVEQYGGIENPDLSEIKDRSITAEYLNQFKRIGAIYEDGSPIIEEVIYPSALKLIDKSNVMEAIDAIYNAPELVDTTRLEKKLSTWLLDYGLNIEGFTKELLPSLKVFLVNPTEVNTQVFSDNYREVFNIPAKQREYVIKLEKKDRDLVYLETSKSEQELFDSQDLLQTEIANVYHRIERVDFEQMKEAFNLSNDITELQAYKDYFNYNEKPVTQIQEFYPLQLTNSLEYLTNEFIADFNVEKLKNPNGLNDKFIVTEKGIEMKYQDPLSISEVKAYLMKPNKLNISLQEYSIISKQMPNLIDDNVQVLNNKYNNRLIAVNNFDKVKTPISDVTKLNSNTVIAKNETSEFLNIEEELFELIGKEENDNVYSRIEKNTNLDYNELNPQLPLEEEAKINQFSEPETKYTKIKKMWKPEDITDKFDCLQ